MLKAVLALLNESMEDDDGGGQGSKGEGGNDQDTPRDALRLEIASFLSREYPDWTSLATIVTSCCVRRQLSVFSDCEGTASTPCRC